MYNSLGKKIKGSQMCQYLMLIYQACSVCILVVDATKTSLNNDMMLIENSIFDLRSCSVINEAISLKFT